MWCYQTPFYPEGGGQIGDKGWLTWKAGRMEVQDTRKPVGGVIVHRGPIIEGTLRTGVEVDAHVPGDVRWHTMRNHTATHLLQKALRDVLGSTSPGGVCRRAERLRSPSRTTSAHPEESTEIERIINDRYAPTTLAAARWPTRGAGQEGAMACLRKIRRRGRMVLIPSSRAKSCVEART